MTALESSRVFQSRMRVTGSPALLGLRPFAHKELTDWWKSRRALILFAVTSAMMVLSTVSARITEIAAQGQAVHSPVPITNDPTVNVLVKWPQWVFFFAIVFSVNLFIVERDRGTLAWSLSKPMSRTALLAGKWIAAMVMFTVFGIVLPMTACVVAAFVAYGTPDLGQVAVATVLFTATPAFFIALTLAAATILPSAPPVAGVAVGVAVAPGILGSFVPGFADLLPPTMGPWAVAVAMGQPASALTPVAWAIGTVTVFAFGVAMLRRADL